MREPKVGDKVYLNVPENTKFNNKLVIIHEIKPSTIDKEIIYWFEYKGGEAGATKNQFELLADPFELWENV